MKNKASTIALQRLKDHPVSRNATDYLVRSYQIYYLQEKRASKSEKSEKNDESRHIEILFI